MVRSRSDFEYGQFVARSSPKVTHNVQANQEVIVAAGAPRSPQLLQLSGIGPQKLLSGLGIEVIEDLPGVGYNFHDQPSIFTGITCKLTRPSPAHF